MAMHRTGSQRKNTVWKVLDCARIKESIYKGLHNATPPHCKHIVNFEKLRTKRISVCWALSVYLPQIPLDIHAYAHMQTHTHACACACAHARMHECMGMQTMHSREHPHIHSPYLHINLQWLCTLAQSCKAQASLVTWLKSWYRHLYFWAFSYTWAMSYTLIQWNNILMFFTDAQ